MFKKIHAQSGCVIFFPTRQADKNDKPCIINGCLKTRPSWREEWVQVLKDLVDIEIRLEGDKAFNLGDDLRCEIIANLRAEIDDTDYEKSLRKIASVFLCTPTTNLNDKFTEAYFKPRLEIKLRAVTEEISRSASYLDLLENPAHHSELSKKFENRLNEVLKECGFKMLSQSIQFNPVNPGSVGRHPNIAKKWMEWDLAQKSLEAEKAYEEMKFDKEIRQKQLGIKAEITEMERRFDIRESEAKNQHAMNLQKYEIELAKANKDKETQLLAIKKELDDLYHRKQEEDTTWEHNLRSTELRNKEKEDEIAEDQERARNIRRLQDEEEYRSRRMKSLEIEKSVTLQELEIAKVEAEKSDIQTDAESKKVESLLRANNTVELEKLKQQEEVSKVLLGHLPDIVKNLPIKNIGETTVITIGKDIDMNGGQSSLGVLGLASLPLIRRLMAILSDQKIREERLEEL